MSAREKSELLKPKILKKVTKKKETKLNGYRIFTKITMPKIRNMKPDGSPQEMMVLLNS